MRPGVALGVAHVNASYEVHVGWTNGQGGPGNSNERPAFREAANTCSRIRMHSRTYVLPFRMKTDVSSKTRVSSNISIHLRRQHTYTICIANLNIFLRVFHCVYCISFICILFKSRNAFQNSLAQSGAQCHGQRMDTFASIQSSFQFQNNSTHVLKARLLISFQKSSLPDLPWP